jgi:ABC-2 type transport system permease protein
MKVNIIGLQTFLEREIQRFLHVWIQALMSPWINAFLYIAVFGGLVGSHIAQFGEYRYIEFVFPGILMLNIINAAFMHTSFSLYFQRFAKHIEEILVAPLSYAEMIAGYVLSAIARVAVISAGIYAIALVFGAARVVSLLLFLYYTVLIATIFALVGLIVALWSNTFEQLSVLNTFVITPLTFLGGVFSSTDMLPASLRWVHTWNPFFYFVDGLRYSMIGLREGSALVGHMVIWVLVVGLFSVVWTLFSRGWRLRH